MQNLSFTTKPTIEKGWKQAASAGFIAALGLSGAQPATAASVANTNIVSQTSYNISTGNYDYSYTFNYTVDSTNAYQASFAIPVFDLGVITGITAPVSWSGSVVAASGSMWNTIYNPLADPKAGTYAAPASAFAPGQVPYVLEFVGSVSSASSQSISGFSFSSPYAPSAAPFVAKILTEGFPGDYNLIGDPSVPASPSFPVPEPASSALLLAAGAMFAARRKRS